MAPVIPDPRWIKTFASQEAFESWLAAHHDSAPELWIKVHKKASGLPSVTTAQALEVVLCWGWIDGLRKSFDESSFLQRYTPRRPRSPWSQVNREHVARLTAAGRMKPPGQRQIDAARADGRWDAATAPIRATTTASVPADLRAAIEANARARKAFRSLTRRQLFALMVRTNAMKTPAGRAKKIRELVALLTRETGARADAGQRRRATAGRSRRPRTGRSGSGH
jgi:uncharacterized protein YdeI (YjbR/CyaY-like superfamily)